MNQEEAGLSEHVGPEVLCFGHCGQMLVLGLTPEVGEEGACR